jgi:hypothetical protein
MKISYSSHSCNSLKYCVLFDQFLTLNIIWNRVASYRGDIDASQLRITRNTEQKEPSPNVLLISRTVFYCILENSSISWAIVYQSI